MHSNVLQGHTCRKTFERGVMSRAKARARGGKERGVMSGARGLGLGLEGKERGVMSGG